MNQREPNMDTLANNLAGQIRRQIAEKGLQEGEFFMTGDELAKQYGVSRGIAREAISQLKALGILKSRQGKGLLVGRSDPVGLLGRSLPFYDQMPKDLRILEQLRYVLEIGAVDLAVSNASEEQIRQLGEFAREYREEIANPGQNEQAIDEVELAFHGLILQMTGNPLVAGMHGVLSEYFAKAAANSPRYTETEPEAGYEGTAWEHEAIVEGIQKRDLEMTRAYLRRHLKWVMEDTKNIE